MDEISYKFLMNLIKVQESKFITIVKTMQEQIHDLQLKIDNVEVRINDKLEYQLRS